MTPVEPIPFNRPYMTGHELPNIAQAHALMHLAGDGEFTRRCHAWLEARTGTPKALLTHSCTAALEMAALLLDIRPGDEVIMPSWTFVSTANAFVLRGAVPVFIDIRSDTLNLDERLIEAAITPRTRAIVPVHYAGVGCDMPAIMQIARHHRLKVVEDAAQGILAARQGKALGAWGDLGTYSFHETKNLIAGEGGALLVNDPALIDRAEILREKGTDRSRFHRGQVDKYTWQDIGSSYLPGELIAAFLWAQLQQADPITRQRITLWDYYHQQLEPLERRGLLQRPHIPPNCTHNAHLYAIRLAPGIHRQGVLDAFADARISAVFHYVPLHDAPAGRRVGRPSGRLPVTAAVADSLIRLPMWVGLSQAQQDRVIRVLQSF
jgi:dTDP-4-amino-4,6-dideoxygalactose transaminase